MLAQLTYNSVAFHKIRALKLSVEGRECASLLYCLIICYVLELKLQIDRLKKFYIYRAFFNKSEHFRSDIYDPPVIVGLFVNTLSSLLICKLPEPNKVIRAVLF